jgi:hypothetical protein
MGKRSEFERIPRDLYPTPMEAVAPLIPHLSEGTVYAEPCCGRGDLINHLRAFGMEVGYACDIEPGAAYIGEYRNALSLERFDLAACDTIITNPPWPAKHGRGEPTLGLIRHLSSLLPTWLLLGADFAHNVYATDVMNTCSDIVPIGRVKWMPGTEHSGLENAAWYKFHGQPQPCRFHPRDGTVRRSDPIL